MLKINKMEMEIHGKINIKNMLLEIKLGYKIKPKLIMQIGVINLKTEMLIPN